MFTLGGTYEHSSEDEEEQEGPPHGEQHHPQPQPQSPGYVCLLHNSL